MSEKLQTSEIPSSRLPDIPAPGYSVAELVTVAMTLMTVPGIVIYLAVVIGLQVWQISLAGNVIAPLLLACVGLVLFIFVGVALFSGIWCVRRSRQVPPLTLLCLWLNGLVLASLIALIALSPPLQ